MYHKHSVDLQMLRLRLSLLLLLEVALEGLSDVILLKVWCIAVRVQTNLCVQVKHVAALHSFGAAGAFVRLQRSYLHQLEIFMILMPFQSHMSKNVVIVGQTGAGKSSLINMLCPGADAPASNDTTGCTKVERKYRCDFGDSHSCQVHDTIGLEKGRWGFLWAPKAERRLIAYLKKIKGPYLLVYCIPAGRGLLKKSDGRNYRKFKSVVGKNVPVVVVVTHLENFGGPFSGWWSNNVDILEKFGIPGDTRHACITTLPKADLHILCMEETLYDNSCADVKSLIRHILSKM